MNTTTQMDMVVLDAPTGRLLGLTLSALIWALSLAIVLAGGVMCLLRPEQAPAWWAAMVFLPLLVAALRIMPGLAACDADTSARLMRSVLAAGLLIFVPLLLRLVEALGVLEFAAVRRSIGVTVGIGVLLAGGYFARRALGLVGRRVGMAVAGRILRFASWGVMAGGLGYALMWLAAPLDVANLWASSVLGAALLLVTARSFVTLRLGNRRSGSRD